MNFIIEIGSLGILVIDLLGITYLFCL